MNMSLREAQRLENLLLTIEMSLKQRAVSTSSQRKYTTGLILAMPRYICKSPRRLPLGKPR